MMSNRMMLNLTRNMNRMDNLANQLASGKRITFPSDDPILAARALKFRTSLRETQQYMRNVGQGLSWMGATDAAFIGVTEVVTNMRNNFNSAINADKQLQERQAIINTISQMKAQLGSFMNTPYAGRYVFSGFRTNHPPIFEVDQPDLVFAVEQHFRFADMETTNVIQRDSSNPLNAVQLREGVRIIKLAYAGNIPEIEVSLAGWTGNLVPFNAANAHIADLTAYDPDPDDIHFIEATGELILGSNVANLLQSNEMNVRFVREGFTAGELNPKIYFNSFDISESTSTSADALDVFGYTAQDLIDYNIAHFHNDIGSITDQRLEFEFSFNTRIPINTLARNVVTDKLHADLRELIRFVNSMEGMLSNPQALEQAIRNAEPNWTDEQVQAALTQQIAAENSQINTAMQNRFNSMLARIDTHYQQISRQEADHGSRMQRLDMIRLRLEEDQLNFRELISDNEDADLAEVATFMAMARAAYEASLRVGASVLQLTLADFIR